MPFGQLDYKQFVVVYSKLVALFFFVTIVGTVVNEERACSRPTEGSEERTQTKHIKKNNRRTRVGERYMLQRQIISSIHIVACYACGFKRGSEVS